MDREQAELFIDRVMLLMSEVVELDGLISDIVDFPLQRRLASGLGAVMSDVFDGLIGPVVKLYPDLDPYPVVERTGICELPPEG